MSALHQDRITIYAPPSTNRRGRFLRDIFEHGLAAVAEARSLYGRNLQAAAQLVDDEGRERFAFDILGDNTSVEASSAAVLTPEKAHVQKGIRRGP